MSQEFWTKELLSIAGPIVTALTAIGGIWSLRNIAARRQRFDEKLARDKFEYDKHLSDRKRKQEIAEEILAGVYELRAIVKGARFPASFSGESEGRPREPGEAEETARMRDSYYVPIARLDRSEERIVAILSKRFRAAALLGEEAAIQIDAFRVVMNEVRFAARMLNENVGPYSERLPNEIAKKYRNTIWNMSADPDPIDLRLDGAVAKIEAVCRPILSEGVSSTKTDGT
jgi:hypothetical protein